MESSGTKSLLLFSIGIGIGYLIFKNFSDENKPIVNSPVVETNSSNSQLVASCQSKLDEQLKVVRISDIETYKTNYMADCLAGKV